MLNISIIIVNWNTKDILKDCLDSIYKTINKLTFEIIVVDNGSTDGSQEMLREFFPGVILICNEENFGFAKANNIGINISKGKYLALINSDIILLDNCFENSITYFDKNNSVGLLGPRILNKDLSFQSTARNYPSLLNVFCQTVGLDHIFKNMKSHIPEKYLKITKEVDIISGCFWVINRKSLEKVGLLDEKFFFYGEDVDWCRRFGEADFKIIYYTGAQAIHLGGVSSTHQPVRFYIELQKAKLLYWNKHNNHLSKFFFILMMLMHEIFRLVFWVLFFVVNNRKSPKMIIRYYSSLKFYLKTFGGFNSEVQQSRKRW